MKKRSLRRVKAAVFCLLLPVLASLAVSCTNEKPADKGSESIDVDRSSPDKEGNGSAAADSGSLNTVRPDGIEIPMSLYSEETPFEFWEKDGTPYYQLCVVIRKSDLDATEGMGQEDYRFTYRIWYREKGSAETLKNLDSPVETCYDLGDSVIYRLQTYPMMRDLTAGRSYELTVDIEEGGNARAWGTLTVLYTESSAEALARYEAAVQEVK